MPKTEKLAEHSLEEQGLSPEQELEEQIIEGEVENIGDWGSLLPEGVIKRMVISKETGDGKRRRWKLLPEYIKDEARRVKEINKEEEIWRGTKQSN